MIRIVYFFRNLKISRGLLFFVPGSSSFEDVSMAVSRYPLYFLGSRRFIMFIRGVVSSVVRKHFQRSEAVRAR